MAVLSYLKMRIKAGEAANFEADMREMLVLARSQPGFRWAEAFRGLTDQTTYAVLSEWDTLEQMKAWEHHERHKQVMRANDPRFAEPMLHKRYTA